MHKVLVTGGAGFIGSHTVDALLAKGVVVRVLDDLSSGKRDNLSAKHTRLEFVEGDIRAPKDVASAMDGVSHCLHLAAQVSVTASLADPHASAERNVLGFINVLEAARAAQVRRFVYASSAAVYGDPRVLPLSENADTEPLSPYGLEKLIDERYADLYQRVHGVSTLGLRYFNVYGPRQDPKSPYAGVIALFAESMSTGRALQVFGDGRQTRDFIFAADVARANIAALEADISGVCNVATGRSVSLLDLIDVLASLSNRQSKIEYLPPREGDIQRSAADISRLRQDLRLQASVGLSEGLKTLLLSEIAERRF
jgi:UDP-glucose 4-epimerase